MSKSGRSNNQSPSVCVFASWPIVSVTVESAADGSDDIYFNAAGQGVWIARMAKELGARTTLCGPFGGHSGLLCRALIEAEGIGLRAVPIAMPNGSYVHDRRQGAREEFANQGSPRLSRHEVDDLYDAALAEGLSAGTVVISGQLEEENLPAERIATLVRDLHRNGVKVVADVSGPTLAAITGGLSILKVSHEELIEMKLAESDDEAAIVGAMRHLAGTVTDDVVVSLAERGALALVQGAVFKACQPALEPTDKTGAGDSMTAALTVSRAAGRDTDAMLRMSSAAGALNVTRRGRGTGTRGDVEEIARRVTVEPWEG